MCLTVIKNILEAEKTDEHHIRLKDFDMILEAQNVPDDTAYAGLRMNYVKPVEMAAGDSYTNLMRCTVLEEVKNPFTYVIQLALEGSSKPFIMMEVKQEEWERVRSERVAVAIDPELVLMLR